MVMYNLSNNNSLNTSNLVPGVPEYGRILCNTSAVLRLQYAWHWTGAEQFTGNVAPLGIPHLSWEHGRAIVIS
jgi:hypothetical protein